METFKSNIEKFLNLKSFEIFILTLIFLNLFVFIFQTDVIIANKFNDFFVIFEIISVIIFTIEYLLRLIVIKNIKEVFSFYMLIDFCAILPFYLSFVPINTIFLRVFRLFRVFRILKIARYTHALDNIKSAFSKRKNELVIVAIIFAAAVLVASSFIYFAEHNQGQAAFQSIPSSFWWAIVTFTTVGYGDAYPVTSAGKFIASLCAIFGIGLHGLLIGIIGTALMDSIKVNDRAENGSK